MANQTIRFRASGPPGAVSGDAYVGKGDTDAATVGEFTDWSIVPVPGTGQVVAKSPVEGTETEYWVSAVYDDTGIRPAGDWIVNIASWKTAVHIEAVTNRYLDPVPSLTLDEIAAAVSSSGAGQYLVPIVIIDDAAVPVPRAVISVYNSDGVYLGIHTASGTEGTATLQLDSGSYQIGVTAHPTHSPALVPLEIADTDPDTLDIVLVTVATTPPGTGGLCRVRIPVREPAVAAPAAQITAQLVDENVSVGNDLLSRAVTRAETDDAGYADLLLPQGVTYRIVGEHGGHQFLNLEYLVPATAEAYLAEALGE